jgi:hypothetical protein
MENDDKDWVEVKLHRVGVSNRAGDNYPPEVVAKMIEDLQHKAKERMRKGECGFPVRVENETVEDFARRVGLIIEQQVSHVIDLNTMRVKDGFVTAMMKPIGPFGNVLEKALLEKPSEVHFGMRAFVQYEEGNTTQTKNLTVRSCDIVTFDLINPQP